MVRDNPRHAHVPPHFILLPPHALLPLPLVRMQAAHARSPFGLRLPLVSSHNQHRLQIYVWRRLS